MRIIRLQAEGFKRLVAVDITPEGDLVEIRGENGNGKSSVLDAIYSALGGASVQPERPVRDGEEDAIIRLDLGDLIVTRYFTAEGTTKLKVTNRDGAVYSSGQTMLNDLVGHISFDPLEFLHLKGEEQAEELRKLIDIVDPETGEVINLDAIAAENKADYDARRDVNREGLALKAKIESRGLYEVPDDLPDPAAIMDQITSAAETNDKIAHEEREREAVSQWLKTEEEELRALVGRVVRMRAEAEELEKEGRAREAAMKAKADELVALPPLPARVDAAALRDQHADAMRIAENKRLNDERAQWRANFDALKAESQGYTAAMREREAKVAKAIAAAKMPVDGLELKADEEGKLAVLFNGVPFSQASDAERLRVSAAVAMASNPKIRVIRLKDASLLDRKSVEALRTLATDNDFQIWAEFVGDEGAGIIMEAGTVRGAEPPEPLEKPKTRRKKDGDESAPESAEPPAKERKKGGDEPAPRQGGIVFGDTRPRRNAPPPGELFGDAPETEAPRRKPQAMTEFVTKPRGQS